MVLLCVHHGWTLFTEYSLVIAIRFHQTFCFRSSVYTNTIRTRNVKCTTYMYYMLSASISIWPYKRRIFAHQIQFANWNPLIKIDERNNEHPDVSNIYLIWRHFSAVGSSSLLFFNVFYSIILFGTKSLNILYAHND